MREDNSTLVYSTDITVPRKKKSADRNVRTAAGPIKSRIIVRLDRKGRSGKSVTVIEGLQMSDKDGEKFLKQLKVKFGTGGTVNNGSLEIQGDHCDAVMGELIRIGFKAKRSGG